MRHVKYNSLLLVFSALVVALPVYAQKKHAVLNETTTATVVEAADSSLELVVKSGEREERRRVPSYPAAMSFGHKTGNLWVSFPGRSDRKLRSFLWLDQSGAEVMAGGERYLGGWQSPAGDRALLVIPTEAGKRLEVYDTTGNLIAETPELHLEDRIGMSRKGDAAFVVSNAGDPTLSVFGIDKASRGSQPIAVFDLMEVNPDTLVLADRHRAVSTDGLSLGLLSLKPGRRPAMRLLATEPVYSVAGVSETGRVLAEFDRGYGVYDFEGDLVFSLQDSGEDLRPEGLRSTDLQDFVPELSRNGRTLFLREISRREQQGDSRLIVIELPSGKGNPEGSAARWSMITGDQIVVSESGQFVSVEGANGRLGRPHRVDWD